MWAMIAFTVKGAPSDQTDSVNPRPDIQVITVREMI